MHQHPIAQARLIVERESARFSVEQLRADRNDPAPPCESCERRPGYHRYCVGGNSSILLCPECFYLPQEAFHDEQ